MEARHEADHIQPPNKTEIKLARKLAKRTTSVSGFLDCSPCSPILAGGWLPAKIGLQASNRKTQKKFRLVWKPSPAGRQPLGKG